MTTIHRRTLRCITGALFAACALPAYAQSYEAYYMHSGNYPVAETPWSDDVQGLAHDDNNWYLTNTHFIWKIPVNLDLLTAGFTSPGVVRTFFGSYPALLGYNHFGDADVFRYEGTDYLVVPIEDGEATCESGLPGGVAIFRCSDLSYVAHTTFPGQCNDAGWVAIDEQGGMVSSRQHIGGPPGSPPSTQGGLRFYNFNWSLLHSTGQAQMSYTHSIYPIKENSSTLELFTMQGGEFAPGDQLLYLVSGYYDDSDGREDSEGIHVIDTSNYQRIQHSTRGFGHFDYYYDPGFPTYEEPEGLTIWNLDDGRAPGIRGQLHVFVSDNDFDLGDSGDIDFKHYTRAISVNATSTCQDGSPACPFRTVNAAASFAWTGSEIRVRAGTYAESLLLFRRVRLSAEGGLVRIVGQ